MHILIDLALIVGIVIGVTLFVQQQRDRRAALRTLAPPPVPAPAVPNHVAEWIEYAARN